MARAERPVRGMIRRGPKPESRSDRTPSKIDARLYANDAQQPASGPTMGTGMLKNLQLTNFRTFKQFTLHFGNGAYLVGPNNAGKTTILMALRVVDVALRYAANRSPSLTRTVDDIARICYPLNLSEFPALADSARHEFGDLESRVILTFKSGARAGLVWPAEGGPQDARPFFFLEASEGVQVRNRSQARAAFPTLGVIPILGPVEHSERVLDEAYVKANVTGRLSSRHFRNQLRDMKRSGTLSSFLEWSKPWLQDFSFDSIQEHFEGGQGVIIDVFFSEKASRIPKELAWAGDGLQVWTQLVSHIYRVRDCSTIVLDEPEVYLHPDLQRRLVRLLESTGKQVILATHSSELIAESDPRLTVLVDKSRRTGQRPRTEADLERMSNLLGTAFNLRLARALKSRVVVFFEGQDASILRRIARTLGLEHVANERGVAIIELGGYSHWGEIPPFVWLTKELLPEALTTFVVLDRDYRPEQVITEVEADFGRQGIDAHIWRRKELESYLLSESAIARISGAEPSDITTMLQMIMDTLKHDVSARLLYERGAAEKSNSRHAVTVTETFLREFEKEWANPEYRKKVCPPKRILSALNQRLQADGKKSVSTMALARALRPSELPTEIVEVLRAIENAAVGRGPTPL